MGLGFIGKKAGYSQKFAAGRGGGFSRFRLAGVFGKVDVAQGFHLAQPLAGQPGLAPLGAGRLPAAAHGIGLKGCQVAQKGTRVVKIAKNCWLMVEC